jgi:hypothetical protein
MYIVIKPRWLCHLCQHGSARKPDLLEIEPVALEQKLDLLVTPDLSPLRQVQLAHVRVALQKSEAELINFRAPVLQAFSAKRNPPT